MALTTFAGLKAAIANYAHRSDLTTLIPDYVTLAESAIKRDVRVQAMEQTDAGTLVATTQALPTRYLETIRVTIDGYVVRYVTPEQFQPVREVDTGVYTIVGTNFVFQSSTADYSVDYYQAFAALSADGDTNWLLTNHPGVYLFASLAEMALNTQQDPSPWVARYQSEVAGVMAAEQRARFSGRLVVRPDMQVI